MEGFLPKEIIEKEKHGMGLPIAPWFKTDKEISAVLKDILFRKEPKICQFIKSEFLSKMKSSFEIDTTSYYGHNLWRYLVLEMWLQNDSGTGR